VVTPWSFDHGTYGLFWMPSLGGFQVRKLKTTEKHHPAFFLGLKLTIVIVIINSLLLRNQKIMELEVRHSYLKSKLAFSFRNLTLETSNKCLRNHISEGFAGRSTHKRSVEHQGCGLIN